MKIAKRLILFCIKTYIIRIAVISFVAAIGLYWLFRFFDTLPTNAFVNDFALNFSAIRGSTLNFLFKVAPFLLTIVIAMSSLTINLYSGTFLELLLTDKSIKFFISYSLFYLNFHILVIFFLDPLSPTDPEKLYNHYVENFNIYLLDFLLAFINSILTLYTAYKVFQNSWPITLKRKFLKNIRKTISQVEENPIVQQKELNNFKSELNQQIGLFINLLLKAIKSKDYDSTRDIIKDIGLVWGEIVSYTNDSKREEDDQQFREYLTRITNDFPDLGLQFDYAGDIYEIGLSKIAHVYSDAFEIAFSSGEYYICEIILESIFSLTKLEDINNEDIRKCLKIYVDLFDISLRIDKKGQTSFFAQQILSYVNTIYEEQNFKDFDLYYDIITICLKLDEPKILKETLLKFKEIFDEKLVNDALYKDTFSQFQGTFLYCLNNKRMKCFAELIRFFVIGGVNLNLINEVFSEKIVIIEEELELLQKFLDELTEDPSDVSTNYNRENYVRIKLYLIWYSYYLLQLRISRERIGTNYRNLKIPNTLKNKIPFDLIRTVLLDVETHESNWKKLFVGQQKYYFTKVAVELLNPEDYGKIENELNEYGSSEFLKKCKDLIKK
jgi:hypothetical protein